MTPVYGVEERLATIPEIGIGVDALFDLLSERVIEAEILLGVDLVGEATGDCLESMVGVLAVYVQWQEPRVLRLGDEHQPEEYRERGPVMTLKIVLALPANLIRHRDG